MATVHFVAPAPEGTIFSDGGPKLPLQVQVALGRERIGTPGRYAIACDPQIVLGSGMHAQGTDQPYLVNCEACQKTEIFKKLYRPHPTVAAALADALEREQAMKDAGCCG